MMFNFNVKMLGSWSLHRISDYGQGGGEQELEKSAEKHSF